MIVIIEGVDGVGKTTISTAIAERLNAKYIKESYTDDNLEKKNRIIRMLKRLLSDKTFIYDRTTLIDDFVYDFLNNTKSELQQYKEIILSILSQCRIIHLKLDEDIRSRRMNQRGDQYITNEMIQFIKHRYDLFYDNLSNVEYVQLVGDLQTDIEKVMEEIKNDKNITYSFK